MQYSGMVGPYAPFTWEECSSIQGIYARMTVEDLYIYLV